MTLPTGAHYKHRQNFTRQDNYMRLAAPSVKMDVIQGLDPSQMQFKHTLNSSKQNLGYTM